MNAAIQPRAALREATKLTLFAWKSHILYGAAMTAVAGLVLAPAGTWILTKVLGAAGGGSVLNFNLSDLALSFRGVVLAALWSLLVSALVVIIVAGHAYIAGVSERGARPVVRDVARHVIADLPRVPGRGALKIALLATLGLPLIASVAAAIAGLVFLPFGGDAREIKHLVPRGLPVPLWMVGAGMLVAFLVFAWLYVRWSLAIPSLALEGVSLTEAARRSVQRTRGSFWKIARAHLRHYVMIAFISIALITLLRVALRPMIAALLQSAPKSGPIALAVLVVSLSTLLGTLGIIATARVVTLTVVHHVALGGEVPRIEKLAAPDEKRRIRLAFWILVLGGLLVFAVATWMAIPRVEAELQRVAQHTIIAAHRGGALEAPENTIASLRHAIEVGAEFAEMDVQQAKDGTVVVVHDPNLKRLAGVDQNVGELTFAELGKLDVGSHFSPQFANERIPSLEQMLDAAKGRIQVAIEVKTNKHETDTFVDDVIKLLERKGFADSCMLTSLEPPFLHRIRQLAPKIPLGAIITAKVGSASDLDVDFYCVQPLIASSDFIRQAHAERREVQVWTINDRDDISRFADRSVDVILTDTPRVAREVLDARTPMDGLRGAARRLFRLD